MTVQHLNPGDREQGIVTVMLVVKVKVEVIVQVVLGKINHMMMKVTVKKTRF